MLAKIAEPLRSLAPGAGHAASVTFPAAPVLAVKLIPSEEGYREHVTHVFCAILKFCGKTQQFIVKPPGQDKAHSDKPKLSRFKPFFTRMFHGGDDDDLKAVYDEAMRCLFGLDSATIMMTLASVLGLDAKVDESNKHIERRWATYPSASGSKMGNLPHVAGGQPGADRTSHTVDLVNCVLATGAEHHIRQRLLGLKRDFVAGTCEWVEEDAGYQTVMQLPPGAEGEAAAAGSVGLHIGGESGMGKSVLSSYLYDSLLRRFKDDATTSVAYFAFDEEVPALHSVMNMAYYCAVQVANQESAYADKIARLIRRDQEHKGLEDQYWDELFLKPFRSQERKLVMVLDGIDQLPEDERERLAGYIKDTRSGGAASLMPVRFILTGTPLLVDDGLGLEQIDLSMRATKDSLRKFIQARVAKLPRLAAHREGLRKMVEDAVAAKTNSFFYAQNALQRLDCIDSTSVVSRALMSLLEHTMYLCGVLLKDFLAYLSEDTKRGITRLLVWLAHSKTRLSLGAAARFLRLNSVDDANKTIQEAAGRGVSSVLSVADRDDGDMSAESDVDKGLVGFRDWSFSKYVVELPVADLREEHARSALHGVRWVLANENGAVGKLEDVVDAFNDDEIFCILGDHVAALNILRLLTEHPKAPAVDNDHGMDFSARYSKTLEQIARQRISNWQEAAGTESAFVSFRLALRALYDAGILRPPAAQTEISIKEITEVAEVWRWDQTARYHKQVSLVLFFILRPEEALAHAEKGLEKAEADGTVVASREKLDLQLRVVWTRFDMWEDEYEPTEKSFDALAETQAAVEDARKIHGLVQEVLDTASRPELSSRLESDDELRSDINECYQTKSRLEVLLDDHRENAVDTILESMEFNTPAVTVDYFDGIIEGLAEHQMWGDILRLLEGIKDERPMSEERWNLTHENILTAARAYNAEGRSVVRDFYMASIPGHLDASDTASLGASLPLARFYQLVTHGPALAKQRARQVLNVNHGGLRWFNRATDLESIFNDCLDTLGDDESQNDPYSLRMFAKTLMLVPGMDETLAQVALSCQFSTLNPERYREEMKRDRGAGEETAGREGTNEENSDEEDADDKNTKEENTNDENGDKENTDQESTDGEATDEETAGSDDSDTTRPTSPYHAKSAASEPPPTRPPIPKPPTSATNHCADSDLCAECYELHQHTTAPRDEDSEPGHLDMCPGWHRHIRAPVEGWGGLEDGMIRYGEQEPVKLAEWLEMVKGSGRGVGLSIGGVMRR
ncbi:hypothetical protein, variant [Gaeumannomyces tritici R3-111a-1]|nr:hypothetical protein, variant [Gaeumannomyces tritici R3-111a-1]EJT80914.1 hypothetical protein, variant [Gaeumannomyces tritici R3-111a-1]